MVAHSQIFVLHPELQTIKKPFLNDLSIFIHCRKANLQTFSIFVKLVIKSRTQIEEKLIPSIKYTLGACE